MSKPIKCIKCYQNRPGGRCDFCPLHKKNKELYIHLENGTYLLKAEKSNVYPEKVAYIRSIQPKDSN